MLPGEYRTALIIGAGVGISASLARALAREGLKVGLAARNSAKLAELATETGASVFSVDASDPAAVSQLFVDVDTRLGEPDVVVYNPSMRAHGPVAEIDPDTVRNAIAVSAFGGFLAVQQAASGSAKRGTFDARPPCFDSSAHAGGDLGHLFNSITVLVRARAHAPLEMFRVEAEEAVELSWNDCAFHLKELLVLAESTADRPHGAIWLRRHEFG